jgi:excisionase family DNA binding protein
MTQKDFLTIKEVADLLGISRVAVFKKVKLGQIKAEKIGRNFAIQKSELSNILGQSLSQEEKKVIHEGVKKTIKEFGDTLEKLGKE